MWRCARDRNPELDMLAMYDDDNFETDMIPWFAQCLAIAPWDTEGACLMLLMVLLLN